MALLRWSDESDVYVYRSSSEEITCHDCYTTSDPELMINHLDQHRKEGDKVPDITWELRTGEL